MMRWPRAHLGGLFSTVSPPFQVRGSLQWCFRGFSFLFAGPLLDGEDAEVITEGVSGRDAGGVAAAGGFAGSGEDDRAVEVTGVGSVVYTTLGPKSLTGKADTGFFSPLFGDFLFFLDTSVQPSSVLG